MTKIQLIKFLNYSSKTTFSTYIHQYAKCLTLEKVGLIKVKLLKCKTNKYLGTSFAKFKNSRNFVIESHLIL